MGIKLRSNEIEFEKNNYKISTPILVKSPQYAVPTANVNLNVGTCFVAGTNSFVYAIKLDKIYLIDSIPAVGVPVKPTSIDVSKCVFVKEGSFIRSGSSSSDTEAVSLDSGNIATIQFSKDTTYLFMSVTVNLGAISTATNTFGNPARSSNNVGGVFGLIKYDNKYMVVDVTDYTTSSSPIILYGTYTTIYEAPDDTYVGTKTPLVLAPTSSSLSYYEYTPIQSGEQTNKSFAATAPTSKYRLLWDFSIIHFSGNTQTNQRIANMDKADYQLSWSVGGDVYVEQG